LTIAKVVKCFILGRGQLLSLGYAASTVRDWIKGKVRFRNGTGNDTEVLLRKFVTLSSFPPKIPDNLTKNRSQVFGLRGRYLNSRYTEQLKIYIQLLFPTNFLSL